MAQPVPLSDDFLFRVLMSTTVMSVYFKDRQCRLLRVSTKMARDLGYADPAEVVGMTDVELFGEEFGRQTMLDDARVMETEQPIVGLTESRRLPSGAINWTLTTKAPVHDAAGTVVGLPGITSEINELKQAELALQHMATHDLVTGLPNRYLMFDRLNQAVIRAERYATAFGILFIDLDQFKRINDLHGHAVGDELLRTVAERLTGCLRAADTVARIGGDEFVVILEALRAGRDATAVARKIRTALGRPFALPGTVARVTVSTGVAVFPRDGRDAETLLKAADDAMYRAKRRAGDPEVAARRGPPERPPG